MSTKMFVLVFERAIFSTIEILVYKVNYIILLRDEIEVLVFCLTNVISITYLVASRIIGVIRKVKIFFNCRFTRIRSKGPKVIR